MLIDSHHHLWKYSASQYGWINDNMSVLREDFLAPQLRTIAAESGVDGFVSVQARQSIEETDTLLSIAATEPLIRGVVGWVPLVDAAVASVLDRYSDQPLLRGVRHVVQDEPDDRFLLREDFNRGIRLLKDRELIYDILIFARQLPAAIEFADLHPSQPFVLDHIAKPTIAAANFDSEWERQIRELARRKNVTCKFSGIVTEVRDPSWSITTIQRYWDVVLDAFSPSRLMFGSDWPVCLLRSAHSKWVDIVRELAAGLSAHEQTALFSGTAIETYGLSQPTTSA